MTGGTLCFRVVRPSVCPSHIRGTTLRAAPSKNYVFSTNYHASITIPTWRRCAPHILFCPCPPYNLFPRLCLTLIFFVDSHWWVPLCVQRAAKAMPFQQISMHVLQFPNDIDVHLLFCADLTSLWPATEIVSNWIFFVDPHWWVPLCVQRLFNKLPCMYCNANMMLMCTSYFVLTLTSI